MSRPTPTLHEVRDWPATVSITQAATALGISTSHLYALAGQDAAPCRIIRIGARYRVSTASLVALLEDAAAA